MASNTLGRNITLPIYNADGTSFHGLELKKFTFDTIVMALGDKITGELYYTTNTLTVAQTEYVVYEGVKYYLINPPTIVKEGMKADNGQAKGMTKYSFTFYHPMFMLNNFPFTDVAVTSGEQKYKSQDKTFYWIGNLVDYVAKLNKNLSGTEWVVEIGSNVPAQDKNKLSEVMQFDKQTMADAVKRGYDTWEIPYVIDNIPSTDSRYAQGKRFLVRYGLPIQDILVNNEPYVFQMGQGVGLKNDSRTPKNNKIVTRIAGFGSEDNVPFGYPQIIWTGNQSWNYTINNSSSAANSYPIYDGIVAGQRVRLIHHPFTRSHLMPTIYADTVNKKVNPYATGYDPTIEIKDYYDAVNDGTWNYPNQIIQNAPSYEIHEFSDIKPELGNKYIGGASAFDGDAGKDYLTVQEGLDQIMDYVSETNIDVERQVLKAIYDKVNSGTSGSGSQEDVRYTFSYVVASDTNFTNVKLVSTNLNFTMEIHRTNSFPSAPWDDSMDDDGNYKQSYFNVILPSLGFDVYACAAVTQEMKINMRSGACLGCSFPVEVDWEDYKKNFYDSDGNFAPTGSQRDYTKYPDSTSSSITVICKKELETFGTLMPNIYQQPTTNDKFVILGISLPTSYITSAQSRLDGEMKQYMLDNNVHYFEYPLKFDEYFLATHTDILSQMKPNILVRFNFAGTTHALYIKQLSVKYGEKPLPQYNITLTDDVEIVLSPIGKVTDEVSSLRVLLGGGGSGGGDVSLDMLSEYFLSKKDDDTAAGMIRFLRGLQVGENFVTGLLGEGGIFRVDEDGTTYLEADKLYIRMRAYFDTVEVKKYLHSGGNRIASKAGINCSRVEWIDANGDVTNVLEDTVKFRCYFRATGDDGHKITNDFVVNDLAFCKETNVDTTSVDQHGYWRCVVAVSSSPTQDGEHWIDLSKTDCLTGSDVPIAQDDIIQLGNKTDTTRQGAIVEFVGGEDAPAYQIYQGINSYSLVGKNYVRFGYDSQSGGAQAYIGNPDGSTYLWYHRVTEGGVTFPRLDIKANVKFTSPTTHQETNIEDFATAVTDSIEDLQEQIDGEIDTWFYDGTPTLNNAPASDWTTATEKERHLGDLYYDIGTGDTGGFAYRFIKDENNVYQWQYLEDTAITEALAKAAEAYDLADHKRRVFYTTPTPPYDNGDLWVNAVWPASGASQGSTYNDDILRCVTSKSATGTFSISDWTLASNYTDDSALTDFVTNTYANDLADIQTQVDGKAETFYQDTDPSTAWLNTEDKEKHVGDIWCDTSANGGKKTYIWRDRGVGQSNRFYWAEQAVPDVVFDEVDKKAAIYVTWNGWITGSTNNLNEKDLFIPAADTTQGGVTYKKDKVYRCIDASIPSFEEIHYTDDSQLDAFIARYVQDLTGINTNITNAQNTADAASTAASNAQSTADGAVTAAGNAQTTADNAAAAAAAADYLRQALTQATDIVGGLVLATTIGLRDSSNNVWAGINGAYQTQEVGTGYKGHGIAAWYGGGMIDGEVTDISGQAKSLFRFDGSGYVAGKNISWDKDGNVTIQGYSINATTLQMGGSNVATESMLANYVTLATDQTITGAKTFSSAIKIGDIYIGYDSTNNALKVYKMTNGTEAAANFYATGGVSALGSSSSGGGGVTLNEPLNSINQAGLSAPTTNGTVLVYSGGAWKYSSSANIFATGITVAGTASAAGFSATGKDDTYVLLAGGGTKLLSEIGGGGSVNGIKIGTSATEYTPDANGIITLPAYPSTSGYVTGISFNGGNPIQPSSGIVGLGGLTVTVKVGNTSYNVSSAGVVSLPAYPIGTVTQVKVGTTAYNPSNGVISLPAYPTVPTKVSQLTNDSGYITGITSTMVTTALGYTPANSTSLADYLPLSGGTLTGFLTFGRGTSTSSSYSQTDNRINAINPDRTEFILIRSLVRDYSTYVSNYVYLSDIASFSTSTTEAGTQGAALFGIGNNIPLSSANSKYGRILLYGKTNADSTAARYGVIEPTVLTNNRTYTLPDKAGTFALTGDIPTDYVTLSTAQTISGTKTFSAQQAFTYNGAPFTVSNNTVVSNLNADLLDGLHGSDFCRRFSTAIKGSKGVKVAFSGMYGAIINVRGSGGAKRLFLVGNGYAYANARNHWLCLIKGGYEWCINQTEYNTIEIMSGDTADGVVNVITLNDQTVTFTEISALSSAAQTDYAATIQSNVASATTAASCTGNAATATTAASCTGNSATATALQTARSLWGNSFDGTADISGTLTVDGSMVINQDASNRNRGIIGQYISSRAALIWTIGTSYNISADGTSLNKLYGFAYAYQNLAAVGNLAGGHQIVFANNGTVYVAFGTRGCWATNYTATGNITAGSANGTYVQIGGARIVWDNSNNALYVVKSDGSTAANFYATGGLSALGQSSSSTTYLDQATADARYLKLSGGQTMTGSFTGTSITLSSQMKAANAVATAYLTVGTSSVNTSSTLYVNGTATIGLLTINTAIYSNQNYANLSYDFINVAAGQVARVSRNWTVPSDMRTKNVVSNAWADVDQIANAPIFNFRYKTDSLNTISLGTSAQYWRGVFPCGVTVFPDEYLGMDYASIALASAVMVARKVQSHEERIAALEAENARLQDELNKIKAA